MDMNDKSYILLIQRFSHFKLRYLILCALYNESSFQTRDVQIFFKRYGFLDNKPKTLQETAVIFGITRERVRQIINRVIKRIKSKCKRDESWCELKKYLEKIDFSFLSLAENGFLRENDITSFLRKEFGYSNLQLFDLVNELLPNKFEVLNEKKVGVSEVREALFEGIKAFPNKYGVSGWVKILKGSPLDSNAYNEEILKSSFYGKLKKVRRSLILNQIKKMLAENLIINKKIMLYPLLSTNDYPQSITSTNCLYKSPKTTLEWSRIIERIIQHNSGWMEINEIAELIGIKRHECLIQGDRLTTIAHLINRFLKKKGFKTHRINYENDYSIIVVAPQYIESKIPDKYFKHWQKR